MAAISKNSIKAVIGLGNPGKQYEDTRHNIGFKVVDHFLSTLKGEIKIYEKFSGLYCFKNIGGEKIHFLKPLTYMNLSGIAVKKLVASELLKPQEIIVIHDDMDFELGTVRLKIAGGSAGHNGIESVIESIQSNDFIRLRVGIGRTQNDMKEHVLDKFNQDELDILKEAVKLSIDAIRLTLARDIHASMNIINAIKINNNKTGVQN
ncbi:MAG TPA: aminoacyl-tRNA hydrolase [Lentisphaeria bacterium]|nr:MAG: aminoacyl-tRNA hydrolase [Lentisphaerae bacterium GWF2_38_69]HBM17156.1 aminoacyl-tRNA hydrolase [Lentisphaeria bacterium]